MDRVRDDERVVVLGGVDAPAVADRDDAGGVELLQRLAQRGRADAEEARHLGDRRQPVARLLLALPDELPDAPGEVVRQTLAWDRCERMLHRVAGR